MADIDFDELDRAVNSLMKDASSSKSSSMAARFVKSSESSNSDHSLEVEESPSGESAADETAPDSYEDASQADEPETTPKVPESSAPKSPLATKRRGQFMDMKHPSADMKNTGDAKPSEPSRVGIHLSPVSQNVEPETSDEDEGRTEEPSDKKPEEPIELADVVEPAADEQSEPETQDQFEELSANPSPFLQNAKVKKRPLGSPLPDPGSEQVSDIELEFSEVESEDVSVVSQVNLPKELHSSILEVEADTIVKSIDVDDTESDETEDDSEFANKTESNKAEILASASIPPQYKVKKQEDTSSDESQPSLYDNAVDHPVFVEKKKSHWLTAIMIFLLLLLGAAGGAVVYLYQTGAI